MLSVIGTLLFTCSTVEQLLLSFVRRKRLTLRTVMLLGGYKHSFQHTNNNKGYYATNCLFLIVKYYPLPVQTDLHLFPNIKCLLTYQYNKYKYPSLPCT
jgi:hypothetical protein